MISIDWIDVQGHSVVIILNKPSAKVEMNLDLGFTVNLFQKQLVYLGTVSSLSLHTPRCAML